MTPDPTSHGGPTGPPLSERQLQARLEALLETARDVGRAADRPRATLAYPSIRLLHDQMPHNCSQISATLSSAVCNQTPRPGRQTRQVAVTTVRPQLAGAAYYYEAVELIGGRWTGAIVSILVHRKALRFSDIAEAVPELSDRLLSERMKELEMRGVVVQRTVRAGRRRRVEYELTEMGRELAPAVHELERWARRWLA